MMTREQLSRHVLASKNAYLKNLILKWSCFLFAKKHP